MRQSVVPTTADELQASYDVIYATRPIEETDTYYRWIVSLLGVRPGDRVLDVACGVGRLLTLAGEAGAQTYGVDISPVALDLARRRGCPARLQHADGEALPFEDGSFDHVTSLGSLEHYLRPEKGAREIARVLKPGGRALIMLPNIYYWRYVVRAAIKQSGPSHGQDLERFATIDQWQRLLEGNGLRVDRVVRYDGGGREGWSQWVASRLVPLALTYHFVYLCGKA
jgi:ubiquinone/menaquinone biosynthesis C-methylase UbiE